MMSSNDQDICVISITSEKETENKFCKICLETQEDWKLIEPCGCRGSSAHVHENCLANWFQTSHSLRCEICNTLYSSAVINKLIDILMIIADCKITLVNRVVTSLIAGNKFLKSKGKL
ncbi:hypothetical protein B4U79_18065 [Dinothrombium tinctorium]|uniref:Uncharacterized protein n=1 Tax=Dinothrombium tinctorium TaxID=1965070 RepID=A0A3S3NWZ0_9ACAR|nr:hypothetical protein B4U79_18065 [Dinothrombium tinctorium]